MTEDSESKESGQKPEIKLVSKEALIEGGTYQEANEIQRESGIRGFFIKDERVDVPAEPDNPIIIHDIWTISDSSWTIGKTSLEGRRYWLNVNGSQSSKVDPYSQGQYISEYGLVAQNAIVERGSGEKNDKLKFVTLEVVKS